MILIERRPPVLIDRIEIEVAVFIVVAHSDADHVPLATNRGDSVSRLANIGVETIEVTEHSGVEVDVAIIVIIAEGGGPGKLEEAQNPFAVGHVLEVASPPAPAVVIHISPAGHRGRSRRQRWHSWNG